MPPIPAYYSVPVNRRIGHPERSEGSEAYTTDSSQTRNDLYRTVQHRSVLHVYVTAWEVNAGSGVLYFPCCIKEIEVP